MKMEKIVINRYRIEFFIFFLNQSFQLIVFFYLAGIQ